MIHRLLTCPLLSIFIFIQTESAAQCTVNVANFDQNPCANSTIELLAYPDDYSQIYSYSWTGPNGFTSTSQYVFIPNAQPEHSGSYTVTMTSAGGCSSQMEVVVIKNPVPVVYTGGQQGACKGQMTEIYAIDISGQYGPYTYLWDDGQTTQTILVGHYSNYPAPGCMMTNVFGCSASNNTTFMIITYPSPAKPQIQATGPTTFCKGGQVDLSVQNFNSFNTYQWRRWTNNIAGATAASYSATQTGSYRVVATNGYGCTASSSAISVTVNPLPSAQITVNGNPFICIGDSVELQANTGSGLSYQWLRYNVPMAGKTQPNLYVKQKGNYRVTVTNHLGCSKTSGLVSINTGSCREHIQTEGGEVLAVYPNPSNEGFRLRYASDEPINVKIVDMTGRVVEEVQTGPDEIIGRDYPAGVYMLITEINGEIITKRMIKTEL